MRLCLEDIADGRLSFLKIKCRLYANIIHAQSRQAILENTLSEHKAKYDNLFRVILAIPLAFMAYAAILTSRSESEAAWGLVGTVIVVALLFWMIMPRKFLILQDRIKFILGASLSFSIHFNNIKLVRELKGASFGINFSTSFKDPVEIVKSKGMKINFSPEDRGKFLYDIENAMQKWRSNL